MIAEVRFLEFAGPPLASFELVASLTHFMAIEAGMDQFGGNNDMKPVLAAYKLGIAAHDEAYMRQWFETSAVRLLKNIFQVGLFENPYLDVEKTGATPIGPCWASMMGEVWEEHWFTSYR